jgi:hypothetical protein
MQQLATVLQLRATVEGHQGAASRDAPDGNVVCVATTVGRQDANLLSAMTGAPVRSREASASLPH